MPKTIEFTSEVKFAGVSAQQVKDQGNGTQKPTETWKLLAQIDARKSKRFGR